MYFFSSIVINRFITYKYFKWTSGIAISRSIIIRYLITGLRRICIRAVIVIRE